MSLVSRVQRESTSVTHDHRAHGVRCSISTERWNVGERSITAATSAEHLLYVVSGTVDAFVLAQDGSRHGSTVTSGGFLRVPAVSIHWLRSTGEQPAAIIRFAASAAPAGDFAFVPLFADWEDDATCTAGWNIAVDAARYRTGELEAELTAVGGSIEHELAKPAADVAEYSIERGFAVNLRTKMVYGTSGSLMVATRPGGYHSTPHVHDSEQLNVVTDGELWGYIISPDGRGHSYHLGPGDLWRVPALAVHWAWNRATEPVTLVEYHSPGLHGDPVVGKSAVSMLTASESARTPIPTVSNLFVATTAEAIDSAERRDPDDGVATCTTHTQTKEINR